MIRIISGEYTHLKFIVSEASTKYTKAVRSVHVFHVGINPTDGIVHIIRSHSSTPIHGMMPLRVRPDLR
jgi:hypothetical protein